MKRTIFVLLCTFFLSACVSDVGASAGAAAGQAGK